MKELYNKPVLTVDEFKLVDVMTASSEEPTTKPGGADEGIDYGDDFE